MGASPSASQSQRKVGYSSIKGKKSVCKYNQDDFSIYCSSTVSMYSVMDGHGCLGHVLSNFVQSYMSNRICGKSIPIGEESKRGAFLKKLFVECHKACLREQSIIDDRSKFDCTYSGTTCTVALRFRNTLSVAFVGDSRCILGVESSPYSGIFKVHAMTVDQNGARLDERRRIERSGGTVTKLPGDVPYRVYVKGQGQPGLAMTRSIGDISGEAAGIIPVPEVSSYTLDSERETFMVVASDGVWEFLSSEKVVSIVSQFNANRAQEAADALVTESLKLWKTDCPYSIDDITCIVAWLT